MNKKSSLGLLFITTVLLFIPLLSCTFAPPETSADQQRPTRSAGTAGASLSRIIAAYDSMNYAGALEAARRMIAEKPAHPHLDHTCILAARSAQALSRHEDAASFALQIQERYPNSPFVLEARLIEAESHLEVGRYYDSVVQATQVLLATDSTTLVQRAGRVQETARASLGPGEVEALLREYPEAPLAEDLALHVARHEFARGNYENAYTLLADLLYRFPQHRRAPEMRRLLKVVSERRTADTTGHEPVNPFAIGVLYPVTGKYSLYGRFFEQGIALAVDDYNRNTPTPVTLVTADSKGRPVSAARATRSLILEDGVLAVIGSVLAMPTVTAAVEANAWGTPFLSPVVTDDELSQIGQWVFQTAVSGEVEVTAMAKCAMEQLLARRFAILSPTTGEKRRLAEFFKQEITTLGGTVVAMQFFEPRSTDFKEQLEVIVTAAPEAFFIPADVDELINILPQIRFYDLQSRLLGLSDWNNNKLIRLTRAEIEGALFPHESFHGLDAAAHERFLELHHEKIGAEVDPLTVAGYFGARLVLSAVMEGMADREEVRKYLAGHLYGNAELRRTEAASLSILTVHNGSVTEFLSATSPR